MTWLKKIDFAVWTTILSCAFSGLVWCISVDKDIKIINEKINRNEIECVEKSNMLSSDIKDVSKKLDKIIEYLIKK
jgi:hypothetical protein